MSALPLDEARRHIAAAIAPLTQTETVPLRRALGRVLAGPLVSTVDVPPHDNAAMDGYALAAGAGRRRLRVAGAAFAGAPFARPVAADECVRIMTGAVMPAGCDAVVPQEDAVVVANVLVLDAPVMSGRHRRRAGEDLQTGDVALPGGRRLAPADLAVAAALGVATLDVVRRPRVAVFSTGNELRDADEPLAAGCIRDANRPALIGLLDALGADVMDLGIVRDEPAALEQALAAARDADAIVTSGGVSAGDADHVRAVVARAGDVAFWSLAIRPGRPMAFGRVGDAWLFALPGNPVAAIVVFHALVRDALTKLGGATREPRVTIVARVDTPLPKTAGRTEFLRGRLHLRDGVWHVAAASAQGAGMLRSLADANALIVLAEASGPVAAGALVDVWPLRGA